MKNDNAQTVTGKQVLLDAVIFAKDAGTYIFELGKRLILALRKTLKTDETTASTPAD